MEVQRGKHEVWSPQSERQYTENAISRARTSNQATLREFARWLEEIPLDLATITLRVHSIGRFLDAVARGSGRSCVEDLRLLSSAGVEDFFVGYGRDRSMAARRSMQTAMRRFLEFAASRGWVERDLVRAVPVLHSYRLAGLPRGLSAEHITTVLSSPWGRRPCTIRDRAIVFLLATYGVRRGQVSALRLADVDWRKQRISFAAHKGGKSIEHTLSAAVAETLAAYLRTQRPQSDSPYVFLRSRPHIGFGQRAVCAVWAACQIPACLPPRLCDPTPARRATDEGHRGSAWPSLAWSSLDLRQSRPRPSARVWVPVAGGNPMTREFISWLAPHFERFVQLRRASGAAYVGERRMLLAFDRYLDGSAPHSPLLAETITDYLASLDRLLPRSRDNVIAVLWPAIAYAKRHGASITGLPARPPAAPGNSRQRPPRIVTEAEMSAVLAAARRLPSFAHQHRAQTIATVLGLMYCTGLRIGEAVALDVGDLDQRDRILTVRRGKFGKSRVLPLLDSTVEALVRYLHDPRRRPASTHADHPFFVSCRRTRLNHQSVARDLAMACKAAAIPEPWPRPHDLRHTFAISRVATWYQQGRDVNSLLPVLSTYLGHVSVESTRLYLVANAALLGHAAARFERHTNLLDQVVP
jgi:integrase